ncbi:hypothetical protein GF377_04235 [candidate division GN15 bacterium]|nr:hypothetical protein [candidate division GN15 bacterium]
MTTTRDPKFVNDIPAADTDILVRKPFKIERENTRRFVRLEISTPMSLKKIKDIGGGFWPEGDWHIIQGMILNISAGGVLVELDQAINEGDVVSMQFTLQDVELLDNVLGLVKRVDSEPDYLIAGIEFITRDYLADHFSSAEMELLDGELTNFDEKMRQVLNKYVYSEATAGGER